MEHAEPVDWAQLDIAEFVALERDGDAGFVSRRNEENGAGYVFGGQILAQAIAAVARTVSADRPLHCLQLAFCGASRPDRPLRYAVQPLSDGGNTSMRSLRVEQAGKLVCVATASCRRLAADGFEHDDPAHGDVPAPLVHPDASELLDRHRVEMAGHPLEFVAAKAAIEMRLVDAERHFVQRLPVGPEGRMQFWVRTPKPLPDDPVAHQCAAAYLTDYAVAHVPMLHSMPYLHAPRVAAASINHTLWFYRPLRADDWLFVDVTSPVAAAGRGLATARIYDRSLRVAVVLAQECVYRAAGG